MPNVYLSFCNYLLFERSRINNDNKIFTFQKSFLAVNFEFKSFQGAMYTNPARYTTLTRTDYPPTLWGFDFPFLFPLSYVLQQNRKWTYYSITLILLHHSQLVTKILYNLNHYFALPLNSNSSVKYLFSITIWNLDHKLDQHSVLSQKLFPCLLHQMFQVVSNHAIVWAHVYCLSPIFSNR